LAVYHEQSITKAAKRLFISQPAISKYIHELEIAYGQKLFDRDSRRLAVTSFGEDLYRYASQVISLYDEMNTILAPSNWREKSLRLGVTTAIGELIIPQLLKQHYGQEEEIAVSVQVSNSDQMVGKLIDNSMDFAITEDLIDSPYITNTPIHQERIVAVCNIHNPLAEKTVVSPEDFIGQPILLGEVSRPSIKAWFDGHAIPITPLWRSSSVYALNNAVATGIGVSFLSRAHVICINDPRVVILNVPELTIVHNTYEHHKKDKKLSFAMQEFIRRYLDYINSKP